MFTPGVSNYNYNYNYNCNYNYNYNYCGIHFWSKVPELARAFGRAASEYEKAEYKAKNDMQRIRNLGTTNILEKRKTGSSSRYIGNKILKLE